MATHSSILAWGIPMDRGAWQAAVHEVAQSRTERLSTEHVCSRAHTHTCVQPNHFAIHPRLIHRKSTALQSQNKACICLTLKLYTLCFTSYTKTR